MTNAATNTNTNVLSLTDEQISTIKGLEKTSPQVRALYKIALDAGLKDGPIFETRAFIIKSMKEHFGKDMRYQHVYNVLNTNLKKG